MPTRLTSLYSTTHINGSPAGHGSMAAPASDLMSEKSSRGAFQTAQTRRRRLLTRKLGQGVPAHGKEYRCGGRP